MNLKAGTVRIPATWQRKQGLEVSCHPWTFHTTIPPAQQLKQCFSIKDSPGCLALLFVVGWVVWGSRMRERESRNSSGWPRDEQSLQAGVLWGPLKPEEKPTATKLYIRTDRTRPARMAFSPILLCTQQTRREGRLCTADLSSRSLWGNATAHLPHAAAFFFFISSPICCSSGAAGWYTNQSSVGTKDAWKWRRGSVPSLELSPFPTFLLLAGLDYRQFFHYFS